MIDTTTSRILLLLCLFTASAQSAPATTAGNGEPVQLPRQGEEQFKRHSLSVLTRYVTEDRAEGGAAIGLDYEYRFVEEWGASVFAEYVGGEIEASVFGAMLNYHLTERLLIGVGPGVERSRSETRMLFRLGGMYEVEVGEIFIAPAVYTDWIEGGDQAFLFGLNIGKRF